MRYNVLVDPVSKMMLPKVFLLHDGTREGRSASRLAILWITLFAGSTRTSLSGFYLNSNTTIK